MYVKIRATIERHIDRIGRIVILTILVLWILSQFFDGVRRWMLEEGLLNIIMIALLVEAIAYIVELKQKPPPSRVFRNQHNARQELDQFISEQIPKKADLIELSTGSIEEMLELLDSNCDIRLLAQHPQKAVSESESKRIMSQLGRLPKTFKDHDKVEIRCYSVPASIRGRYLGEKLLNIGWYTYEDGQEVDIFGHNNPMLNVNTDTTEGMVLKEFFTETFDHLWEKADPLEEVLTAIEFKA